MSGFREGWIYGLDFKAQLQSALRQVSDGWNPFVANI